MLKAYSLIFTRGCYAKAPFLGLKCHLPQYFHKDLDLIPSTLTFDAITRKSSDKIICVIIWGIVELTWAQLTFSGTHVFFHQNLVTFQFSSIALFGPAEGGVKGGGSPL